MTPETRPLDSQLLRKLLLGELPSAEVESLAIEFANDDRLAEMAESLAAEDETLRALVGNNETAVDSAAEPLVERLLQRLQLGKLTRTSDPTVALSSGIDATEAGFAREARVAPKLPERLEYYRPLKVLGQGGMGTVYLAEDTRLGREVALKTLRPEFAANPLAKERFLREARAAARLEHDHVVPIYYVGEAEGTPFLAMPLLKGESLDAMLRRIAGPLPVGLAVRLAREIASGLAAAHAQGLIHRDIKPANIWLETRSKDEGGRMKDEEEGVSPEPAPALSFNLHPSSFRTKILDFGLAKAAGLDKESDLDAPLTSVGMIVGTPGYMAPEQASGQQVDARTDLFSLGCVLYQMLTGKVPFSGSNPLAMIRSLAVDMPAAPEALNAKCPAALSQLVMRLLEKEPAARPDSAEAVVRALSELEYATQLVKHDKVVAPVRRRQLPSLVIALGIAALALVCVVAFAGKTILRVVNNEGELIVTVDDPNTEVLVKGQGVEIRREENGKKRVFLVKAREDGEVEVREPGSDSVLVAEKFKVTRAGKVEVQVTAERLAAARAKPAVKVDNSAPTIATQAKVNVQIEGPTTRQRKALEWVLANGGEVVIDTGVRELTLGNSENPIKALPNEPFRTIWIRPRVNGRPFGDEDVPNLSSLPPTHGFALHHSAVTDAGIDALTKQPWFATVTRISLQEGPLTDAGLVHLLRSKSLNIVQLHSVRAITDQGLTSLRAPDLNGIELTGLPRVKGTFLRPDGRWNTLNLFRWEGAAESLRVEELVHLASYQNLTIIVLRNSERITDAELAYLAKCRAAIQIDVSKTKASRTGISRLAKSLPKCRTVWDGGVVEPIQFTNSLGMDFAIVPKGKAWLGGGGGIKGETEVEFKEDFYLGIYEVTQEQWRKVFGANPSVFSRNGARKDAVEAISDEDLAKFPVESVSWFEAQAFVKELNSQLKESGWEYRLPTEAEWEYACRGGPMSDQSEGRFDFYLAQPANELSSEQANIKSVLGRTAKVGSYQPNRLGLYDLHGNVWEWSSDPRGVFRGGGWNVEDVKSCSASNAGKQRPTWRNSPLGLRVARVPVKSDRYTNSLGMEFALIPKGKAWLGGGAGRLSDREVELADDYYLGVHEVTQEQWEKVMGKNPSAFARLGSLKESVAGISDADLKQFPVESVSWSDAQGFVQKLNKLAPESGWTYRLPAADEWEYACRGGPMADRADSAFDFVLARPTNQLRTDQANIHDELKRPCKVGSYAPNRLGLYDMHGNIWEWSSEGPNADRRWLHGGCYAIEARFSSAANRGHNDRVIRFEHHGLRVARVRIAAERPPALAAAPFDEQQAKAHQEAWANYLGRKVVEENSLGMKMTLIPPGRFQMGCADVEKDVGKDWAANPEEQPVHEVELTQTYLLSSTEITQEQFEKVLGRNTSAFSPKGDKAKEVEGLDAGNLPVETVTWHDAVEFCNKLSEREGLKPYYVQTYPVQAKDGGISISDVKVAGGTGYRLPTEAEWEYACRAGTQTRFSFPFDYGTLPQYGWFGYASERPHDVGTRKPNAFGLHDMHGNVFEWCGDWFANYSKDAAQNPSGPATGTDRVARGGSYNYLVQYHRSAFRGFHVKPGSRPNNLGFRVARTVPVTISAVDGTDPDRQAAEWVLFVGGRVRVNEIESEIATAAELPKQPFRLTYVNLQQNTSVTDAGLAYFKNCKDLIYLNLWKTPVSDAALANFASCKNMTHLVLGHTVASDSGVAHFKDCKELTYLDLYGTGVTDEGMAHFKDCQKLTELMLGSTRVTNVGLANFKERKLLTLLNLDSMQVTDAGLAHFKNCRDLTYLNLWKLPITDAGLANFEDCKQLTRLYLGSSMVTDTGLARFKDCENLTLLDLSATEVTDAILADLRGCKNLRLLNLDGTRVTAAAVAEFRKGFPNCEVIYRAPDRRAAEWVLSVGGALTLRKNGTFLRLKQGDSIPDGPLEVFDLSLLDVQTVDDASIENLKDIPRVTGRLLLMNNPKLGDAGLAKLVTYPGLADISQLTVSGKHAVSESGFKQINSFAKLTKLSLGGPGVTDVTLENVVRTIVGLTELELSGPVSAKGIGMLRESGLKSLTVYECHNIDDDAMDVLASFPDLTQLTLSFTPISDSGLERLAKCKALQSLTLTGCNVRATSLKRTPMSDAGIKKLAAARPDLRIQWDDGLIDPKGAAAAPDKTKSTKALNRQPAHLDPAGWKIEGDELVQTESKRARLIFGDPTWTDYDLNLETKTTPGKEGSQGGNLLFRVASPDDYLCLSLGGYAGVHNEIHYLKAGKWGRDVGLVKTSHETDRWYKVAVQVRGAHVRCMLDGETIFDFDDEKFPKGSIGLQTWNNNTPIRWRNIRVVSPEGKVLWEGLPELAGEEK